MRYNIIRRVLTIDIFLSILVLTCITDGLNFNFSLWTYYFFADIYLIEQSHVKNIHLIYGVSLPLVQWRGTGQHFLIKGQVIECENLQVSASTINTVLYMFNTFMSLLDLSVIVYNITALLL